MVDQPQPADRAPETVHLIVQFLGTSTLLAVGGVIALAAFKVPAVIVTPVVALAGTALGQLGGMLSSIRSTSSPTPQPQPQVNIDTLPPPPEMPPPYQPPPGTL